jgi:tetratricopeptide (TPR) repeat protein
LLEELLVTNGEDDPSTLNVMYAMGMSLTNQNRVVEAHSTFEKVLERRSRVLGDEHPHTLMSMRYLAETLYRLKRYDESLAMFEIVLPKQEQFHGEDHFQTLDTRIGMVLVLKDLDRFEDAHRTATRGLIVAREGGNEKAAAKLVDILSYLEQHTSFGGGKGEQKKKSSNPYGGTDEGGARESGGAKVKACAVCMSTAKAKACSGCKRVFYVSWIKRRPPMSNLSNPSLSPTVSFPFYSTRTVWGGLSIEALEGTQAGLQS